MEMDIKLRAWNPEFGEMIYSNMDNEYCDKREWYPVCFEIGFSHYPHTIMDNNTVLMLFTYQQDKHRTNIFVGDILSEKWKAEVFQTHEGTFMVRFHTNPTRNKPMSLKKYLQHRDKAGTSDRDNAIIGNIYENPDLISD